MKSCFFIFIIFYSTSLNNFGLAGRSEESFKPELSFYQEAPFYFLKPVPPTTKLLTNIDLSFFRNQAVVTQYRYRLEIPNGGTTAIDRNFTRWSPWISFDFIEMIIPILDQEGGYRLNIEYRTSKDREVLKFEKLFYVYRANPLTNSEVTKPKTVPRTNNSVQKAIPSGKNAPDKTIPAGNKATAKTSAVTNKTRRSTSPVIGKITIKAKSIGFLALNNKAQENKSVYDKQNNIKETRENRALENVIKSGINPVKVSREPLAKGSNITPDINKLLTEAIKTKDETLFKKALQKGAGIGITGIEGGNIFHLMNDNFSNEETISFLINEGFSLNEKDSNGNSPLHIAILSGENKYAWSLINQGADLNIKNKLELSPLHLAAVLNDRQIVNQLLIKGAEINIKGNSGYTPLHIASELNYVSLVKDLLYMGANPRIKTDQKLTPKAIAKIQDNPEIFKLIAKKSSYALNPPKSNAIESASSLNTAKLNVKYDFNLPYNNRLVKKRQFNKAVMIISIPIFVISTAGTAYLRSEANNYFSSYKNAETIDMAKHYYDKTIQYDTYTYIAGGISLSSAFGIVHSSIRKKSITNKMRKTLY